MYISLSDDKHRKVRDSSKKCTGNPRQNVVQDKIQSENFFPMVRIFFRLNFLSDCICLRLNLSQTEFVSD